MEEMHTHELDERLPTLPPRIQAQTLPAVLPAFQDLETGETHLSMHSDGSLATVHLLEGLPDTWILERNRRGQVMAVKESVVAGFVRSGEFYIGDELFAKGYDA
jgi:hypothetical protein